MRKLTNKDIARIVKHWLKGKPITKIAEFFQISRQRVHQIIKKFKETGEFPFLRKPGRKPKEIDEETEKIILQAHKEFNLGPVHLEKKIEEVYGIHIPHNTIYKILLKNNLVEENMKKKFRILTDHGTQFVPARNRDSASHKFREFLAEHGVKHIVARIEHPQTNGKIERFFGEVERRVEKFGSVEAVVKWHNEVKPHRSLDWDEPINAFWYKLPPERVMWFVRRWWDEEV